MVTATVSAPRQSLEKAYCRARLEQDARKGQKRLRSKKIQSDHSDKIDTKQSEVVLVGNFGQIPTPL
jgi:hypothetical protein